MPADMQPSVLHSTTLCCSKKGGKKARETTGHWICKKKECYQKTCKEKENRSQEIYQEEKYHIQVQEPERVYCELPESLPSLLRV